MFCIVAVKARQEFNAQEKPSPSSCGVGKEEQSKLKPCLILFFVHTKNNPSDDPKRLVDFHVGFSMKESKFGIYLTPMTLQEK